MTEWKIYSSLVITKSMNFVIVRIKQRASKKVFQFDELKKLSDHLLFESIFFASKNKRRKVVNKLKLSSPFCLYSQNMGYFLNHIPQFHLPIFKNFVSPFVHYSFESNKMKEILYQSSLPLKSNNLAIFFNFDNSSDCFFTFASAALINKLLFQKNQW